MNEPLREAYARVKARVERAALRAGRDPAAVRLVAVGKTQPASALAEIHGLGHRLFGENYVQELLTKQAALPDDIEWHFIGGLQRNKARQVIGRATLIHGVDRLELARELSRRAVAAAVTQACLIEVNLGAETSKSGVASEEAKALARAVCELPGLALRGLMSLPPPQDKAEALRPYHRALRLLAEELRQDLGLSLPELSMGMSLDFEVAIEEGATLVRVGSDIFGARHTAS